MKNNILKDFFVPSALVVLLILFLNPFDFWMPNIVLMMMILGLVVVFSIFSVFIWKENPQDEREGLHKMMADRTAFLVGAGVLVIGIIVQSLKHSLDTWLVFTLAGMILAKTISLIYSQMKN
ncbi:MAG: hypothetical protein M3Q24_01655 [bacterium]|nr:hypothetical protein [bacterium]